MLLEPLVHRPICGSSRFHIRPCPLCAVQSWWRPALHRLGPHSSQIFVSYDQAGHPQISLEMQGSAINAFGRFTDDNIDQYLAITFDRKVIESAIIQSAISGPAVINGNFTQQQAYAVIADLKAGAPLPVSLTIVR